VAGPKTQQPSKRKGGLGRVLLALAPWAGALAFGSLWLKARAEPRPGLSHQAIAAPEHFEQTEPGRGRLAAHPHAIPLRGWKDILWRTYREIGRDRLNVVAGGVTFYSLLALFPAIGVFVSIYGLVADVGQVREQLGDLAAFIPPDILNLVGDQMVRLAGQRQASLSVAFAVSFLLSIWTANAGMAALFDGLNVAYDETEKRNFFVLRGITLGFTVGAILFITATTGILVALPIALLWLGWAGSAAWVIPLRWVLLLAVATFAFTMLYRYGPSRQKARWRWISWGAVAAAFGWIGGSLGFSWYLNNVAHYDVTYGSLGAVIGFMVWIWFSIMVVLLGAELNAEIEHQTALDSTTGAPMPMGERGAAMADTVGLPFLGVRDLVNNGRRQVGNLLRRTRPPEPPAATPDPRRSKAR
jgi:membrane protein